MGAIRNLIRRYPAAAIAIVLAAAGFGGWTIYQQRQPAQPGIQAVPGRAVTPTSPSGAAAPGAGATTVTPTSPLGATPPESTRTGRANPFEPLTGPSNPGTTPAGGSTIPPVPPLAPSVAPGAAPPVPLYRVAGFLWSDRTIAILEDGRGSYIVGPGDTVRPGVQVLAIDVRRELVRLDQEGIAVELALAPIRRSP